MTTEKREAMSKGDQVDRRTFIKTTGVAAGVVGGIEGILAARRAPAFAQGTKMHWVRWVDFIPESDVELKRQMPEASKALGAECVLETINANDLQARITAAIQSGAGADIFNFQYNWAHLYQNAVSDEIGSGIYRTICNLRDGKDRCPSIRRELFAFFHNGCRIKRLRST